MRTKINPTEKEWYGLYVHGWEDINSKDPQRFSRGLAHLEKFIQLLDEDKEKSSGFGDHAIFKRKILKRIVLKLKSKNQIPAAAYFFDLYEKSLPSWQLATMKPKHWKRQSEEEQVQLQDQLLMQPDWYKEYREQQMAKPKAQKPKARRNPNYERSEVATQSFTGGRGAPAPKATFSKVPLSKVPLSKIPGKAPSSHVMARPSSFPPSSIKPATSKVFAPKPQGSRAFPKPPSGLTKMTPKATPRTFVAPHLPPVPHKSPHHASTPPHRMAPRGSLSTSTPDVVTSSALVPATSTAPAGLAYTPRAVAAMEHPGFSATWKPTALLVADNAGPFLPQMFPFGQGGRPMAYSNPRKPKGKQVAYTPVSAEGNHCFGCGEFLYDYEQYVDDKPSGWCVDCYESLPKLPKAKANGRGRVFDVNESGQNLGEYSLGSSNYRVSDPDHSTHLLDQTRYDALARWMRAAPRSKKEIKDAVIEGCRLTTGEWDRGGKRKIPVYSNPSIEDEVHALLREATAAEKMGMRSRAQLLRSRAANAAYGTNLAAYVHDPGFSAASAYNNPRKKTKAKKGKTKARRARPNQSVPRGANIVQLIGDDGVEWANYAQARAGVMSYVNPASCPRCGKPQQPCIECGMCADCCAWAHGPAHQALTNPRHSWAKAKKRKTKAKAKARR